jgi:membrane dipeptidase
MTASHVAPALWQRCRRCLALGITVSTWALASSALAAAPPRLTDAELHEKAIVVEGHAHVINSTFSLGLDPWTEQAIGGIDYARARKGGVDVIVEQLYIEDGYNDYNYTVKQAVRLLETFNEVLDANRDKMEVALSAQDVRRIVGQKKLAIVLALEGGFDMEGDLRVLRLFHRLGVRMVQMVNHEQTNAMADSQLPKWHGLSAHGRAVVAEMNRLGIVIDISHASDASKLAMIEASRAPVVTSHNGVKHFSPLMRGNMSDEALVALGKQGGLFALHSAAWILSAKSFDWGFYWGRREAPPPGNERFDAKNFREPIDYGDYIGKLDALLTEKWKYNYGYSEPWRVRQERVLKNGAHLPTVDDWADEMAYVIRLMGPDHVGIGLDLMSGGNWMRDFDATSYPRLTTAMRKKGFSDDVILKVLGENWLHILDSAKVP